MTLTMRPVQLGANSSDREARLVLEGEELVAILSRLTNLHGSDRGKWYLEIGFGRLDDQDVPLFFTLEDAREWIADHLIAAET